MPCLFRRTILTASSAGLLAAVPGAARAQEGWPKAKPVRVIIPYSPASAPDNVFRLYAEGLTTRLGASFVVENRSGGAGMIGTEAAARAVPDGYTLLVSINAPISVNRHLYTRMSYDPERDLRAVAMLAIAPLVLVTPPANGRDMDTFLARMRTPGKRMAYGSTGIGSASHLLFEAMKMRTGLDLEHVPYRGTPEALTDILGGRVAAMLSLPGQVQAHLQSGALVPLMQTSERRMTILPDVPTSAEVGLDEVVGSGWMGLFVPGATPEPVVARLAEALRDTAADARLAEALVAQGYTAGGMDPAQMTDFVARESANWGEIIRRLGLRVD